MSDLWKTGFDSKVFRDLQKYLQAQQQTDAKEMGEPSFPMDLVYKKSDADLIKYDAAERKRFIRKWRKTLK
jgi:hypothetical protein